MLILRGGLLFVILLLSNMALARGCQGEKDISPSLSELAAVQANAKKGDSEAELRLGMAYLLGKGMQRNHKKGMALYWSSAKKGNAEAQYLLGRYYANASRSPEEYRQAVTLLKKAVGQNCYPALWVLGMLTRRGQGVKKDKKAGLAMIKQAAKAGVSNAQWWLGGMQLSGEGVPKNERAGFLSIQQAANQGNEAAQLSLANLYLIGKGTHQNAKKAIAIMNHVYDGGNPQQAPMAAYMLGWTYMVGKGVKVNNSLAFQWMIIAAGYNVSDSQKRLAKLEKTFPEGTIKKSCPEYRDTNDLKKVYGPAKAGDRVRIIQKSGKWDEVYFPKTGQVGMLTYVRSNCVQLSRK